MVFTSHVFIFYFLPIVLLIYYCLPYQRNLLLLVASYIFYGWWDPSFVLLMLFATVVNYVCGLVIAGAREKSMHGQDAHGAHEPARSASECQTLNHGQDARATGRATAALVVSVVTSLGLLGFFKYFTFAEENLSRMLVLFGAGSLPIWRIALPIGISFYIFHNISYTVDVYRGIAPPVRSFRDFACFIALFPQLVAGPILRYNVIAGQLVERTHTLDKFSSGVALFIIGFGKKILLANAIAPMADAAFAAEAPGAFDAWLGVIAYAFQIYFDFSGYSDMAIGLGRMVGFEFPRNFDGPYRSESITEFWRRWHISLSTFLRDYLYIPLGGNRVSARRNYFNLTVVMLLGGLWHGANWTFVAWGAFHGVMLAFERMLGKKSLYAVFPRPARIGITFVLVLISWVLFRSDTLSDAMKYLGAMFGSGGFSGRSILLAGELYNPGRLAQIGLCAILAFGPIQGIDWVHRLTWARCVALIVLFCVGLATMFTQAFNPFLYFQF